MSVLSVENINTGYDKKQVLFDINFEAKQGECVLLVGSNGSGKSTLFKAIYKTIDLWNKTARVLYCGEDTNAQTTHQLIKNGLVYIPQKDELFDDLTVMENLELSVLHLRSKKEIRNRIKNILDKISILKPILKQKANSLSGGERKLLSLAMALLNKPKVLLYDEPLSGLSSDNIKPLIKYLIEIKEQGTTLILIEHRINELLPISDRIIGLKLGHLSPEKLTSIDNIKTFMI